MYSEELDEQRVALFQQLKPLCVSLLQSVPAKRSNTTRITLLLSTLHSTLASVSNASNVLTLNLIEYVFNSLQHLFQTAECPRNDAFIEGFLKCTLVMLEASWWQYMTPTLYRQLFIFFVSIIEGPERSKERERNKERNKNNGQKESIKKPGEKLDHKSDENSNDNDNTASQIDSLSEDTKLICLCCILALNPPHSQQQSLRQELCDPQMRIVSGRCIFILLEYIKSERMLELRVRSLETLQMITNSLEDASIVASFLPGVVSTLGNTLIESQKENHRLLTSIVDVLGDIIVLVMKDSVNDDIITKIEDLQDLKIFTNTAEDASELKKEQSEERKLMYINRTNSWHKATSYQIKTLLSRIFTIRNHSSAHLRLSFSNFSYKLLFSCSNSLSSSLAILLETLLLYLSDSYIEVSIPTKHHMVSLQHQHGTRFEQLFVPTIKENLDKWLTNLPRYLMGIDENAKRTVLDLISGHVRVLGREVQSVLNNSLIRMSFGLLAAVEFDKSVARVGLVERDFGAIEGIDSGITEDARKISEVVTASSSIIPAFPSTNSILYSYYSPVPSSLPPFPRIPFKYLSDSAVHHSLSTLFRLFGYYGNLSFLIDHFLSFAQNNSPRFHAECVLIVNEIVLGAGGYEMSEEENDIRGRRETRMGNESSKDFFDVKGRAANDYKNVKEIAKGLVTEYVEWNREKTGERVNETGEEYATVRSMRDITLHHNVQTAIPPSALAAPTYTHASVVILQSQLLRGISILATILSNAFRPLLLTALYPILSSLTSPHSLVSSTAQTALVHVSYECGYASPSELILDNLDYIVNDASRKLQKLREEMEVIDVLSMVVKIGGIGVLLYIEDIVGEILMQMDKWNLDEDVVERLSRVLENVVLVVGNEQKNGKGTSDMKGDDGVLEEDKTSRKVNASINTVTTEYGIISSEIADFIASYSPDVPCRLLPSEKATLDEIGEYFLNIHRQKESQELSTDQDAFNSDSIAEHNDSSQSPEATPVPTQSQQITLSIVDKLVHFLPASSSHLRYTALNIIRSALSVFYSLPNELNPLVHRLWPLIINRLGDEEHYVILAAAEVIETIAITSGDFVMRRIIDDVWPRFKTLLGRRGKGASNMVDIWEYSISHRMKVSILRTMCVTVKNVELTNEMLFELIDVMYPLLNKRQHERIQSVVTELFGAIAERHADAVWLITKGLVKEYSVVRVEKRHVDDEVMRDIVWPEHLHKYSKEDGGEAYRNNVDKILEKIQPQEVKS
ncbi:4825_t:CDS:2 [Paraglomus brasilianum]|uniref:4825_t:CDS:1 n=1 Tax=Paraglomus brasilianum TaxID=144538 RepID=A0A9N8WDR6_9GLOM|nr:4825_t:CDS:2 [Paraglomus brasilianum]